MNEFRTLLRALDPWLRRRCQYHARTRPGLDPDDLYQEAVREALERAVAWFQMPSRTDRHAQAKALLNYCVRHVVTREDRLRKRIVHIDDLWSASDEDDGAVERIAPRMWVEPVDNTATNYVLEQVRAATTPPRALCVFSLKLPGMVERDDAGRAKDWKKGGSRAVPRELDEAWGIYRDGRDRPKLVADVIAWKDHVGVAWYTEGPIEEVRAAERRRAASKVERYANHGLEDLRKALLGQRVGA